MSIFDILGGGNIWNKTSKILSGAAFGIGLMDSNKTGADDIIATCLSSAASGLDAYGNKDLGKAERLIDSLIAGLNELKTELRNKRTQ